MSPAILTLLMLAGTLGANPSDVVPLNSRNFQIPILIKDGQRDKIKELILFSSTDQGITWNQAGVATPDKDSFTFYAPNDGLYWFNITVVDTKGNREPDIYKTPPRQKVLVDTVRPNLRLSTAERQGDEVAVGWEIQEPNPDLNTLRLEYRSADAPQWAWSSVSITPALVGQTRFRPPSSSAVTVRLQMSDLAGNLGSAQTEIATRPITAASANVVVPTNGQPSAVQANPATLPPSPVAATNVNNGTTQTAYSPPPGSAPTTLERTPPVAPGYASQPDPRYSYDRSAPAQVPPAGSGYVDTTSRYGSPVANSTSQTPQTIGGRWPGSAIVPLQLTNNPQVSLEYQVTRMGPSGVGSVELYLTEDDGRTWRRYAEDPDLVSPINATLPGEGVFGLRLVVASKAGLGKKPPQPGDLPQMRIEVDTTPPVVKLFYPQADAHRRDTLILTWTASDKNLASNPITLQWAERPDGLWNTIASELPNSGRYTWQLSAGLPYRVYMRITARDSAGNTGVDETPEPVLIDLHEPEGQLLGLTGTVRK
jgi:hypothetical protein